jgi:acyl carrier protein
MTEVDIRKLVIAELGNVAPETDAATIDSDTNLREALDIDSLDFLNFLEALRKKTAVSVPEQDYDKLLTINRAVAYLVARLGKQ